VGSNSQKAPRLRAIRHQKFRNRASFLAELPDLMSELPYFLSGLPRYAVENTPSLLPTAQSAS